MTMTDVLAITAFLMALGAVFLANDAIRKAEHKNEAFIKGHVERLAADIAHNKTIIIELRVALEAQAEQLNDGENARSALKDQLTLLEKELAKANTAIDVLNEAQSKKKPRKSA